MKQLPPPVAIYCRVSTHEQANGHSLEMQVAMCKTYAMANSLIPPEPRVYTDVATSANLLRPGMQALLADLPQIGSVVVYKLDRLTRSLKDWCHLLERIHCVRNDGNYTIISQSDSFDLAKPDGRMHAAMLMVFAQYERENTIMRTTDALAQKRGSYADLLPIIGSMRKNGASYRKIAVDLSLAVGKDIAHTTIAFLVKKHFLG